MKIAKTELHSYRYSTEIILSNSLLNKLIVKKQFCTTEKFGWTGGGMHDGLHVILKIVQINILSVSKNTYI